MRERTLCTTILLLLCLAGAAAAMPADKFLELCAGGSPEAVAQAIDGGADVNGRDNEGRTPLMGAAEHNGNPEVIRVLVAKGADVNADSGWTVLMYAAQENDNPDVAQALLESGADINAVTEGSGGMTALMRAAAWNKNPKVVQVLLDGGADVAAGDESGVTALMYAATYRDSADVLRRLLSAGADPNARDEDGWTALMWGARHNMVPDALKVLLQAGADPLVRDDLGHTAFHIAMQAENEGAVEVLERGADTSSSGVAEPKEAEWRWPVDGFVKGTGVNLRKGPAKSEPVLGVFRGDTGGAVLVLEEVRKEGDRSPWYRVLSRALGEGWVYGQYLDVPDEAEVTPLNRYGARIELDFGYSPDLAVKTFGPPDRKKTRKERLADFGVTVLIEILTYADHEVEYWNGVLRRVEVWGGPLGFGPVTVGMDAAKLSTLLGEPQELGEGEWHYYDPEMASERLTAIVEEDMAVSWLRYERALYE